MNRLLVVVLISGCSTSIPLDEFCAAKTNASCNVAKRCGTTSPAYECGPQWDTACTERMQTYVDAGVMTYDATAAKKCVDAIEQRKCDEAVPVLLGETTVCETVLVGVGKEGERCGGCEAGLLCLSGLSGINDPESCGTCTRLAPPAADGESCKTNRCGNNSYCRELVCVPLPGRDEPCGQGRCQPQFRCSNDVCVTPRAIGATCERGTDCQGGLWCDRSSCQLQKSNGSTCDADAQCHSTHCFQGTCVALSRVGEPCAAGCALPAVCVDDTCVPGAADGESCVDKGCAFGWCQNGVCRDTTLQCR